MRSDVLTSIHTRTCEALGARLTSQEALAVSVAASAPRERADVFGMLLNSVQSKAAMKHADKIAPTDSEWEALFGKDCSAVNNCREMTEVATESHFDTCHKNIEEALRCSLMESKSNEAWSRLVTKASCYVALHSEDAEARMSACLGGIVRADSRRLDDVRSNIEDGGADCLVLTKVVIALARSVA
tara:strand:- start:1318 stop:1875 length:558 start_codon:yes stop_codon:yes gene_type:complete